MYPQTLVQIVDNSVYNKLSVGNANANPVCMQGFTSDKGTEEFEKWSGNDWFKMFGATQDFRKHGQPLKQAASLISAGAAVYCKRIVAPDAKLANLGVYVHIQKFQTQKKDESGNPLYVDATTGKEVTTSDNGKNVVSYNTTVNLKYNSIAVDTTSNDMNDLNRKFRALVPSSTANDIVLPLFIIAAAGRGKSTLRWRIAPDYKFSRGAGYAKYLFDVYENGTSMENYYFAAQPEKIENDANNSLLMVIQSKSLQVRCESFEDNFIELYHTMESILGLDVDSLANTDFLFGNNIKGDPITGITVDTSEFNLQDIYGNALQNGDAGSFGDAPMKSPDYETEMVKVFNGEYSEEVYNLDSVHLDLVMDANYPESVKRAIENFVTFREDTFFLRDMGTAVKTITEFKLKEVSVLHNRYSSSYCNWFTVVDPQTKKHIVVTITYLLCDLIVKHFINGCNRPFAGIRYGIYFAYGTTVVKNSVNFIPKVTPNVDEKQQLEDIGVNYCSIYDGDKLVVETLYTAQHVNVQSQLSFSCNVWAIQRVIKALRSKCPKSRYAFINGNGLQDYQSDIKSELNKYSSDFVTFDLEYANDPDYEAQKIYYATLSVKFKNFVQAELFKIIALPSS